MTGYDGRIQPNANVCHGILKILFLIDYMETEIYGTYPEHLHEKVLYHSAERKIIIASVVGNRKILEFLSYSVSKIMIPLLDLL